MRRSTTWALAASLLVTSVPTATVSSQSEVASRTTAIPGTGLAVTLPAEWRIWSPPAGDQPVVIATNVRTRRSCTFAFVEDAESAEGAAQESREMVEAHKQLELTASTALDVPIGEAVRVSYRYRTMPDEDRFVFHEYYITGSDGVASTICQGVDPPADRWLSIVESLQEVGVEGTASAPFDPRVEVPDHGFAIDFGAEWLVRDWVGPGPVLGGTAADYAPPSEMSMIVLRAVTTEGGPTSAECIVEDASRVPGLPETASSTEWQAALLASAEAQRQKTSIPDVATVEFASGRAVRADWGQWRGTPATVWLFIGDEHRLLLFCRADQPPADDWLSIAETFEFLPVEE